MIIARIERFWIATDSSRKKDPLLRIAGITARILEEHFHCLIF